MDAPPVHYVKTSDGYDIAYAISGGGPQTVVMAPLPFGNLREQWASATYRPRLESFVSRFRLIQYDSRGEGMSTRGLPDDVSLDHYERDLDAVMQKCGSQRVVIYGPVDSAHVAVRYSIHKPERVAGLILFQASLDDALEGVRYLADLARNSWENFLKVPAYNFYRLDSQTEALRILRESTSEADFFKHLRMAPASLAPLLPLVRVPTLVVAVKGPLGPQRTGEDEGRRVAALLPDARLLVISPEEVKNLASSIAEFAAEATARDQSAELIAQEPHPPRRAESGLSARELEVLRLLALGRSNQQIADELVISLNTVRRHVSNIFDKAGVANRTEAANYARDHHLT